MKQVFFGVLALLALIGLATTGVALGNGALGGEDEAAMMASPSTVVLAKVSVISVHTNIPLASVDAVALNGVAPVSVYADNLGCLAAKFKVADLGLTRGQATLTLTGVYEDGEEFIATDTVMVR